MEVDQAADGVLAEVGVARNASASRIATGSGRGRAPAGAASGSSGSRGPTVPAGASQESRDRTCSTGAGGSGSGSSSASNGRTPAPGDDAVAEPHRPAEVGAAAALGVERLAPAGPGAQVRHQADVGRELVGVAVGEAAADHHEVDRRRQLAVGQGREFDQLGAEGLERLQGVREVVAEGLVVGVGDLEPPAEGGGLGQRRGVGQAARAARRPGRRRASRSAKRRKTADEVGDQADRRAAGPDGPPSGPTGRPAGPRARRGPAGRAPARTSAGARGTPRARSGRRAGRPRCRPAAAAGGSRPGRSHGHDRDDRRVQGLGDRPQRPGTAAERRHGR